MRCVRVVAYQRRLDALFGRVASTPAFADEFEMSAHWGKYLCVLVSGLLEVALREIYSEYARTKSAPHFANFVRQRLEGINNPDMDVFYKVAHWFSPEWEAQLRDLVDDRHETAINSIIGQRHLIAHGRVERSVLTFRQIWDWYKDAVEVIEIIETQCGT
jgi:hypothetical protein